MIGKNVAALETAIADAETIECGLVFDPESDPDGFGISAQAKAETIATLKQMRDAQVQAEADRKARADKERREAEERRTAEEAERQRLHEARMAELKESAPPLPRAALEALAVLTSEGLEDIDVAIHLQIAIERDRDVIARLLKLHDEAVNEYAHEDKQLRQALAAADFARTYIATGEPS